MKISIIISLTLILQVSATVYSQNSKLDIAVSDTKVKDILKMIEMHSNFRFFFNDDLNELDRKLSISANNKDISEILSSMFSDSNISYKIFDNNVVVIAPLINFAQQLKVKGYISDASNGEPVIGANIIIEGTTMGTVSDVNGQFSLDIPKADAVLVISFLGYNTERIVVGNQSEISIKLIPDIKKLEEVVVIGYGSRNKKDITTAISTISSEKITARVSMSPELAMQGQMSGVQILGNQGDPFSRQTVRIRGVNTWGISAPLYVIDGIPIKEYGAGIEGQGDAGAYNRGNINIMSMIDPNDIESISVLKDAASAAIYGVRAGNGVILITTKKGRKEKTTIDYSSKVSFQNQYQHLDVFNTKEYAEHFYKFYTSNGLPIATNKSIDAPFFDPSSPSYLGNNPTIDWQEAGKNEYAPTQEHSVRVSGGTEKTDYSVSFGYTNQESVKLFNNLERYSGAININTDINKYLRTGINVRTAYEKGLQNGSVGSIASRAQYPPWQLIYDENGTNGYANAIKGYMPDGTWSTALLYGSMTRENFIGSNSLSYNQNSGLRMMGTAYVEISPVKNLKLRGNISMDKFNNEINAYYQYLRSAFSYSGASPLAYPNSKGYYEERNTDNLNTVKEFTATYNNSINRHNFDLLFNAMSQTHFAKIYKGYSYYMTTTDKNLFNLNPPLQPQDVGVTTNKSLGALAGVLFRVGYNYSQKYYLDVTARRDGSSRFAPDNRWATFPGVSVAWRATEEEFLKRVTWLNDLKLRASWGSLGNQEVNDMAYLSSISGGGVYSWGTAADGKTPVVSGATVTGMANKILTWEKTKTMNIGFDFTLFRGLSGSFEYYDKITDGILQTVKLPLSAGVLYNPVQNIGKVSNRGIEINLNYQGEVSDFQYSVGGNLTTVKNRVEEMYKGIPMLGSGIEVGYPMFYIYGYEVGGMFQSQQEAVDYMTSITDVNYKGKEALINGGDLWFKDLRSVPVTDDEKTKGYSTTPDSKVDQFDQHMLGKTIPGFYYGINLSCNYKGFDFSIQGMGVGDVQKINSIKRTFLNTSAHAVNQLREIRNAWTPENTNTSIPRLFFGDPAANTRMSNYWVEDADYFRISNIQLGYSLPGTKLEKWTASILSQGRIYVGCANALTLTNYTGLDPEDDYNPAPFVVYTGISVKF